MKRKEKKCYPNCFTLIPNRNYPQLPDGKSHVTLEVSASKPPSPAQSFHRSGSSFKTAKMVATKLALNHLPWVNSDINRKKTMNSCGSGNAGGKGGKKKKSA
jgi:hypothetical protein